MRRDWLNVFLPVWAVGSVVWVVAGFVMFPIAFRKSLLYSPNAVWTTSLFDPTMVDMEVARALAIVIGPPALVAVVAVLVVVAELIWGWRRAHKA